MDLPLVMAALMNRYGEDILPEEVAYAMEDKATRSTGNAAYALGSFRPASVSASARMHAPPIFTLLFIIAFSSLLFVSSKQEFHD